MLRRIWQPESGRQLGLYAVPEGKAAETARTQAAEPGRPQNPGATGEAEPGSTAASEEGQTALAFNGSTAEDADDSADEQVASVALWCLRYHSEALLKKTHSQAPFK